MATNYFIICTRGCTASRWLSRSLEMLKGFECSHGTGSLTNYKSKEYSVDELVKTIHSEWFERQDIPILEYLQKNRIDKKAIYSGNVHRYQLHRHNYLFIKNKNIPICNIVRHPVTWVDSRTALYQELSSKVPHLGQQQHYTVISNFNELWPFSKRHNISLTDPEVLAFISNIAALYELKKDADLFEKYKTFKMESICGDKNAFLELVNEVTEFNYEVENSEIDSIFKKNSLHSHRTEKLNESETFKQWPEWKKELFIPVLNETQLPIAYKAFNYNWDFISENKTSNTNKCLIKPMQAFGPYWINTNNG